VPIVLRFPHERTISDANEPAASWRIGSRFNRMRHRGGLVLNDGDGFREALNRSCDLSPDGLFDLPDGQISDLPVQPLCKNIPLRD
jgi:hypothetical protein